MRIALILPLTLAATVAAAPAAAAKEARVVSDTTVGGFPFAESVACAAPGDALYVSQFVSALKPTEKDGQGRISKVGRDGKMIEAQFLPAHGDVLHKPKGVWVNDSRLWVTDIDAVWVFDLESRRGRKLALPGAEFANDVAVSNGALYVSDNRLDAVFRIAPADFLDASVTPEVVQVAVGQSINPNGVYPGADGRLLLAGMGGAEQPRGIYALGADGSVESLGEALGQLDGLYQTADGTLLVTDWASGALLAWQVGGEARTLAGGFDGPADFCALPTADGLDVVIPDLVKGELRLLRLE